VATITIPPWRRCMGVRDAHLLQAGFVAFSVDTLIFRSTWISIVTLLRSLTADLDYESLAASNRIFGPFFFICFQARTAAHAARAL
jgi:hypothetical protein